MARTFALGIFIFTLLFFGVFFIFPIYTTVKEAFLTQEGSWTLDYVIEVFRNQVYLEGLRNAFGLGIASTLLALAISLPLALLSTQYRFPGKKIFSSLILVPLILPPFVGAIGIKQILGQCGALNAVFASWGWIDAANPVDWLGRGSFWGVAIMNALHLYPILFLNISAALANIDPAMEEAAENLGAGWWSRFRKVTLPLMMPGIFAGGTIVFIWSFTELGVPLVFDYSRVTSVQIFDGIKDIGGNPFPYALVVVVLISTAFLFLLSKLFFGRSNFSMNTRATMAAKEKTFGIGGQLIALGFFLFIFAAAILPHIGVVLVSFSGDWYQSILPQVFTFDHYEDTLSHPLTLGSIRNSLQYASLATLVDIFLGVAIAWVVVRSRIPGRQILDTLAMLPLAVPGLVLAFGYLATTREGQPLHWLAPHGNPVYLLTLAYAVRRLPYIVRSAVAGYQQTNISFEEAAQNLGASPFKTLRKITLPLIMANLIAGGLLAFSFAMLEVSDSLILAEQQRHFPITKAIYSLLGTLGNGPFLATALGVWAMLFLATTIIGASILLGKKLGALFRV